MATPRFSPVWGGDPLDAMLYDMATVETMATPVSAGKAASRSATMSQEEYIAGKFCHYSIGEIRRGLAAGLSEKQIAALSDEQIVEVVTFCEIARARFQAVLPEWQVSA